MFAVIIVVVVAMVAVMTMMAVMIGAVGGYSNVDSVTSAEVMNTIEIGDADARNGVRFVGAGDDMPRGDAEASHDDDHSRYHSLSSSELSICSRERKRLWSKQGVAKKY